MAKRRMWAYRKPVAGGCIYGGAGTRDEARERCAALQREYLRGGAFITSPAGVEELYTVIDYKPMA